MKNSIVNTLFNCWLVISIIYSIVLSLSMPIIWKIITHQYETQKMNVISYQGSIGTKIKTTTIKGYIDNDIFYTNLGNEDGSLFLEYVKESDKININYADLISLKITILVTRFSNSNYVLFIPKDKTAQYAINNWLRPIIWFLCFAYIPLIILLILKKYKNEK